MFIEGSGIGKFKRSLTVELSSINVPFLHQYVKLTILLTMLCFAYVSRIIVATKTSEATIFCCVTKPRSHQPTLWFSMELNKCKLVETIYTVMCGLG